MAAELLRMTAVCTAALMGILHVPRIMAHTAHSSWRRYTGLDWRKRWAAIGRLPGFRTDGTDGPQQLTLDEVDNDDVHRHIWGTLVAFRTDRPLVQNIYM
jgi:hypothetical protein